jgi:transposase
VISIPAGARVVLAMRPVDFRKGAHSLAALAQAVFAEDPFSGAVIVYRAKRSDRIKILVWDGSGLVLIWKQLNENTFRWPPSWTALCDFPQLSSPLCSTGSTGHVFRQ